MHGCCVELEAITEFMKQLSSRKSKRVTPDTTKTSQGYTERACLLKIKQVVNKTKN